MFANILLFSQCREKIWYSNLKKIDPGLLYKNNTEGWELSQEFHFKLVDVDEYALKKVDGDTLKVLFFQVGKDGSILVDLYKKRFPVGLDTCFLEMNGQDTLYFFKRSKGGQKVFYVGEYAYQMTYMKLDTMQLDYYLNHEDSLRRIKGNGLPDLPRN